MKVKIIDEGHESDLEKEVNKFISENDIEFIEKVSRNNLFLYIKQKL